MKIHVRKKKEVVDLHGFKYNEEWRTFLNECADDFGLPPVFRISAKKGANSPEESGGGKRRKVEAQKPREVDRAGREIGDARLLNLGFEI